MLSSGAHCLPICWMRSASRCRFEFPRIFRRNSDIPSESMVYEPGCATTPKRAHRLQWRPVKERRHALGAAPCSSHRTLHVSLNALADSRIERLFPPNQMPSVASIHGTIDSAAEDRRQKQSTYLQRSDPLSLHGKKPCRPAQSGDRLAYAERSCTSARRVATGKEFEYQQCGSKVEPHAETGGGGQDPAYGARAEYFAVRNSALQRLPSLSDRAITRPCCITGHTGMQLTNVDEGCFRGTQIT